APAPALLGIGDGGMGHALFIVCPPGREGVALSIQRLAHASHVAVAENGKTAGEQRYTLAIDLGLLRTKIAHQRLRHGQPNRWLLRHRQTPATSCSGTSLLTARQVEISSA